MLLLYLACNQIWLNLPVDHHQFGYITKLTKKPKKKHSMGVLQRERERVCVCTRVFCRVFFLCVFAEGERERERERERVEERYGGEVGEGCETRTRDIVILKQK